MAALAIVAVLCVPLALLPFLVSTEQVRQRIVAEAAAVTGRTISFRDTPRVTFRPFLGIEISNVIFEDPYAEANDAPLLQMEALRGQLAILPALLGRVSITRYQFVRPRFNFRVHQGGRVSWAFPQGEVWTVLDQARAVRTAVATGAKPDISGIGIVQLGAFELVDGTINYENRVTGHKESITNVNGRLVWPNTGDAATLDGNAIWRGEAFSLKGRVAEPLLLLSGASSAARFEIDSSAIDARFKGEANMLSDLQLRGSAKVEAPSVRRLMELAGNPASPGSTLAGFSVAGTVDATQKLLNFTEAEVALDGNRGRGTLQIALSGRARPKVSGTLALSTLDATPYFASLRQDAETGRNGVERLNLADHLEFDLRLSAATAKVGGFSVSELAAAFSLRPEEALVDIGNARLFGGTTVSTIAIRRTAQGAVVDGRAAVYGMDMAAVSAALPAGILPKVSGVGEGEAKFASHGVDHGELLRNLTGHASLAVTNGEIAGVDLIQLRQQAGAGDATGDVQLQGQTAFREIAAELDLVRDLVLLRNVTIANSKVTARLVGKLAMRSGNVAMRLHLPPAASGVAAPQAGEGPALFIGGSLREPLVTRLGPRPGPAAQAQD